MGVLLVFRNRCILQVSFIFLYLSPSLCMLLSHSVLGLWLSKVAWPLFFGAHLMGMAQNFPPHGLGHSSQAHLCGVTSDMVREIYVEHDQKMRVMDQDCQPLWWVWGAVCQKTASCPPLFYPVKAVTCACLWCFLWPKSGGGWGLMAGPDLRTSLFFWLEFAPVYGQGMGKA